MENKILKEIVETLEGISEKEYNLVCSLLRKHKRVFVCGTGRSGLIGRCFAIRLRHLGIESYIAGQDICPPIKKSDLFIAISSSGIKKVILSLAEIGKKEKATILTITSKKDSPLNKFSDYIITVPMKKTVQFGSSLFEQVVLIFLDTLVEKFRKEQGISYSEMKKRHTNLE